MTLFGLALETGHTGHQPEDKYMKINYLFTLLLCSIFTPVIAKEPPPFAIFWKLDDRACLALPTGTTTLKTGEKLTLIAPSRKKALSFTGTIKKKISEDCLNDIHGFDSYQLIIPAQTKMDDHTHGVAVLLSEGELINNQFVSPTFNNGKPVIFTHCQQEDTVHLNAWDGQPLTGKRLWHGMDNLEFAGKTTCRKAELGQ
ncbi:hypothetical protein HNQ59_003880 [Chitinivorax tropicus]|uniref:Uncharacterized protein n=1 Tax=Chitinivorax tropicus TaxID=714531 RepID=A0A840MTZ9_9PROT|nr:hypothetical protein [Chitinivorax tropicus]MBB5020559.1 hypothetical protein [Chitinivorax tropicus]